MAIEHTNYDAMMNLTIYYLKNKENYDQIKRYLDILIEKSSYQKEAILQFISYYEDVNNNLVELEKYCIMGLKMDDGCCSCDSIIMQKLCYIYKQRKYDLFKLLLSIKNKSSTAKIKLDEFKQNKKITDYMQNENNLEIVDCIICYQNTKCMYVTPKCVNHKVCINCNLNITICPYKC